MDDGGHLTIYIKSNGEVGVRHQTADSEFHYSGGSITLGEASWISYSWGPDGSTLVVDGVVVDTGTEALTMAGDVEPIVFGASQAHSGDGTANNLRGHFEGDISRVQIHDEPLAENTPVPCFVAGTPILTPTGEVPVEQLTPGDLVITADHDPQPLVEVHHRTVGEVDALLFPKLRPVVIPRGALGNSADLCLSRQHCVCIKDADREVLIRAAHLAKFCGGSVFIDDHAQPVTYVHLLLKDHQLLVASGIKAESLLPGAKILHASFEDLPAPSARPILSGPEAREFLTSSQTFGCKVIAFSGENGLA